MRQSTLPSTQGHTQHELWSQTFIQQERDRGKYEDKGMHIYSDGIVHTLSTCECETNGIGWYYILSDRY